MSEFAPSSSLHDSQYVNVPLGFKFKPSDKELVYGYLIPKNESHSKKNKNKRTSSSFDIEVRDVYGIKPWILTQEQKTYFEENEGYYFAEIKKSIIGNVIYRESELQGYGWKNTEGKKSICDGKAWKRILRFEAKAGSLEEFQKGWVIHEYSLPESNDGKDWVLCLVKNNTKKFTLSQIRALNWILDEMDKEEDILSFDEGDPTLMEIYEGYQHALICQGCANCKGNAN